MPSLFDQEEYVFAVCRKLRGVSDIDLLDDVEGLGAYLSDLVAFVKKHKIGEKHQSLKGLILYNYLRYSEQHTSGGSSKKKGKGKGKGKQTQTQSYNKALIKEYLKIPQQTNPFGKKSVEGNRFESLTKEFVVDDIEELQPIFDDEPYIRRALTQFCISNDKIKDWDGVVGRRYLEPLWSEVALLIGRGNEKFVAAQIGTLKKHKGRSGYKQLRRRVELEFSPNNKTLYSVQDSVAFDIVSKNNPVIEVNVYRVAAKNYFKSKEEDVPVDINLNGSSPIVSFEITCDELAIRRIKHTIEIPDLVGQRGIFAIDIIGNGQKLRSLVRKGELRFIFDQDNAGGGQNGYIFKVFNEKNEVIEHPCIWMDGVDFYAQEDGTVHLPFADGETRNQMIILEDQTEIGSATLQYFKRESPTYNFECGLYIDREQLRERMEAQVLIRAHLYMNREIISLENLENIRLKLVCIDNLDQVRTRIEDIQLSDTDETVYTFTVPSQIRQVECLITCSVSGVELMAKQLVTVNTSNDTMAIADMFMFPSGAAGYVLACLGKNGEGHANQKIDLQFKHRYFREMIERTVQTDENGFVYLGRLLDVSQVDAFCDGDFVYNEQSFDLLHDSVNLPTLVNRSQGTDIRIPFIADNPRKPPTIYLYDSEYIIDFSDKAEYKKYFIVIKGLPAGDYKLHIRDVQNADIDISVSGGLNVETSLGHYVVARNRVLQLSEDEPLNIIDVKGTRKDGYKVKLRGCNDGTRVHLLCLAHNPCFNAFGFLCSPSCPPDQIGFTSPFSNYLEAVALDAEYDYIMNRKGATKFVGNLLERPSTLSTGWTDQNVQPRSEDPATYLKPHQAPKGMKHISRDAEKFGASKKRKEGDTSSLDYLGAQSMVVFNLKPEVNEKGVGIVNIPADTYVAEHNLVQILAMDDDNTALRNIILEETETDAQKTDVRLGSGLNPEAHFTESRKVICLPAEGAEYVIQDFSTAEYEPYEGLDEPFNLYRVIASKCGLRSSFSKFQTLVDWVNTSDEDRLKFYDQYQCHEVNFFLMKKDPEFFAAVVRPTIANKVQKSFLDLYMLGSDIEQFKDTHRFLKLNCFERILLCGVLNDEALSAKTIKWVDECAQLKDINPNRLDELFDLGVNSRQLGVDELDKQMLSLEQRVSSRELAQIDEQVHALPAIRDGLMFGEAEEYLSKTRQHIETFYYGIDFAEETTDLISPNRMWADYARWMLGGQQDAFLSKWFQTCTSNLNEMLLSLAVMDLPLVADEPTKEYLEDGAVKIVANTPCVLYLRELMETEMRTSALCVSTNYFDPLERTHVVDGEVTDKFITSCVTNHVYGCRLVVTNVTSVDQTVEVLAQIPTGSIPAGFECFKTKCWIQKLPPFGTYKREFFFYFPEAGTFQHFPVHVNKNGKTIGAGATQPFPVAAEEKALDTTSWKYISNLGSNEDVLAFLRDSPEALNVNLEKICWRCKDKAFFAECTNVLRDRRIFNDKIWAYSLISDTDGVALGEYLAWNPEFRAHAGPFLASDLVNIDLAAVRDWQILEFWPLCNPRQHTSENFSESFTSHFYDFLKLLAFKSTTVADIPLEDKFLLLTYLLLRNNFVEAKALFDSFCDEDKTQLPMVMDYFSVYINFLTKSTSGCEEICNQYTQQDLPASIKAKWEMVLEQILHKEDPTLADELFNAEEVERQKLANKPSLNFDIDEEEGLLNIKYKNVELIRMNFYVTDLEVLFSAHPFKESSTGYKLILPNTQLEIELDPGCDEVALELPEELQGKNTIIEMLGEGVDPVVRLFNDNNLDVQLAEDEGEIRVLGKKTGAPVRQAYVKVYGKSLVDGKEEFFKDGYTDMRGRFDYRQLSTDQLRQTKALAILVSTEDMGKVVLECNIPLSFISQSFLPGLN